MNITPEMFGLTKEEVAEFEKQDERIAKIRCRVRQPITGEDFGFFWYKQFPSEDVGPEKAAELLARAKGEDGKYSTHDEASGKRTVGSRGEGSQR